MKLLIKFFSFSVFLVCILPMFQTCSDNTILEYNHYSEVIVDSKGSEENVTQASDSLARKNKKDAHLREARQKYTLNAYELGFLSLREFKMKDFKDWTLYPALCFTISIFISLLVLINAFKDNTEQVFKLSFINLILLISSMLIFIFKIGIEEVYQIRYGYYVLISNILALIVLSRKMNRKSG